MNYQEINRKNWNDRTEVHFDSEFYDNKSFLEGRNTLNDIELALLGDLKGKSILHLQCHFGQDTISLARLGAKAVGIDLSDNAIEKARLLAEQTQADASFVRSDVYDLPNQLDEQFDIVFTSYGTIGWLPDMDKWAAVINHFLKPGGKFVFAEFHPVIWMYDDNFKEIAYSYFNTGPIIEMDTGTYTDREAPITNQSVGWNHSQSEVINSLIKQGLTIEAFNEYDYSPYDCFNETVQVAPNKFRIKHLDDKIPMVYAILAGKNS